MPIHDVNIRRSLSRMRKMLAVAGVVIIWSGMSVAFQSSSAGASSSVSGRAFQDFNMSGTNNTSVAFGAATDVGIGGITVSAYSSSGALLDSTTTAADGSYTLTLSVSAGTEVRVEFATPASGPLAALYPSYSGTDNGTTIQFVTAGSANVTAAYNVPGEYCQNSPNIGVVRLCHAGDTATLDADVKASPTLFLSDYDGGPYKSGYSLTEGLTDWSNTPKATESQTGSLLGLAYDRRPAVGAFYASAYVRRHTRMYESPEGTPLPGALFKMTGSGTSFLVDLETLLAGDQFSNSTAGAFGHIPSNADRNIVDPNDILNSDPTDARDSGSVGVFEEVGATGIGDIDMDDAGNLYVVSLYSKHLYKVAMPSDGSAPTSMTDLGDITAPITCTNGDPRPFGLQPWRGLIYLGVTCDGSLDEGATDPDANITANIVTIDPAAGSPSFTAFITAVPLGKAGDVDTKGSTANNAGKSARWWPWLDTFTDSAFDDSATGRAIRPVPMFSDIDFDSDGSIIMSFRDRTGDQLSPMTGKDDPDNSNSNQSFSGGDVLRLCRTGTGFTSADYQLEGTGSCPTNGTNGSGAAEYYKGDGFAYWHRDTGAGFSEQVPGFTDLLMTMFDPWDDGSTYNDTTFASGGVKYILNSTGDSNTAVNAGGGVQFYTKTGATSAGSFRKVNGMADIEAACDQAPVQIGNRVWIDTDQDGIQDPGEVPVAGVTVRLYGADGTTLLGTAITNAKGEYYFSSNLSEAADGVSTPGTPADSSGGGLSPGVAAVIKLDNPADYTTGGPLSGYELTTSTAGTKPAIDSNATLDTYPKMTVTAVGAGQNDHRYDVGFFQTGSTPPTTSPSTTVSSSPKVSLGDYVWYDKNRNGRQDAGDTPLKRVRLTIKTSDGRAVRDINGNLVGPAYTDAAGRYSFVDLPPGRYRVYVTTPAGYGSTKASVGTSTGDSSSRSALSRSMSVDGDHDPTLDFGFVRSGTLPGAR